MLSLPKKLPTEQIEVLLIREMRKNGEAPEAIYAFEKTALWITFQNHESFSKKELELWDSAQFEYRMIQSMRES